MRRACDDGGALGRRLLVVAAGLAFPRYPGTAGDARVIAILEQRLRALGLETEVEPFSYDIRAAMWSLRAALATGALLTAAAGWIMGSSAPAGLLLLGLAVVPGLVFLAWSPWLERLYRRPGPTETANVMAQRHAASARATLIVMAHHDSKSQSLSLPVRAGFTLIAILLTLALAALGFTAVLSESVRGPGWLAPGLGIDAIPFAHRGIPCLTLASGSLGRATMSVHSASDVAANLDPAALASVFQLATYTVDELIGLSGNPG